MGGDQCIHNAVIGDLGHAAAVVIKVAGCHAGNNGQIPGAVLLPEFFSNSFQNTVRGGVRAKAADSDGHTVMDQVHSLGDRNYLCHRDNSPFKK